MNMRFFSLNDILKSVMQILGKNVAKRPYAFVFFSCFVTLILGLGITKYVYESMSLEFITIKGGKYEESKKVMLSLFPEDKSKQFNPGRLIQIPVAPIIYILHKNNGSSLIDKSVFQEIAHLDTIVRNISIETEKGLMNYASLCAIDNGACFINPLIKIIRKINEILDGKYRFKFPVNIDERKYEITPFVLNMGDVTTDNEGYVEKFTAARLIYYTDVKDFNKKNYISQWEKAVIEELKRLQFDTIKPYATAFSEVSRDIRDVNEELYPFTSVMVVSMIIFSMLSFITNSWIRSKPWLGLAAGISAGLAIVSAYGAMIYAGVPCTDLTVLVAFIVLGTEIDDAFIMVASWRNTNLEDSVEQRMAKTYSEAAVSVTVSSLTSLIAYCIGMISPIAVVYSICLQCAVCVTFTYIYQLFFFGSFMALEGYREKSKRNAFIFCKITSDKDKCDKKRDVDGERHETLMKCMQDILGSLLQFPICKAICFILFVTNVAIGGIYIIGIEKGSDVFDVLSTGSDVQSSLDTELRYFAAYQHSMHIVINKTLNYWEKNIQDSIENMLMAFENHPNVADPSLTVSWLKFYKIFMEHPFAKSSFLSYDTSKKENFIDGLRRAFLKFKPARQFIDDINFNENFTEITSTRYIIFCTNISTMYDEIRLMNDIDVIVKKSDIPIIIYSTLFIRAEQASIIEQITIQTIWITSLLMFVVFLIFVANFAHAVIVTICVASSMIGTLGFMAAWGLKLDIISLIIIVAALGFSINYSAHMSYAFTTSQADTSHEKMKDSIYRVGLPILQGSLSTILAVSFLISQNIYIYIACFRIVFLTVVETCFHSLIILPVFLTVLDSCINYITSLGKKKQINLTPISVIESHHL